jgi:hypothetical protein
VGKKARLSNPMLRFRQLSAQGLEQVLQRQELSSERAALVQQVNHEAQRDHNRH